MYYDIFIQDVETGMEDRISKDLRARDPRFSPGDSLVVFVHNAGGNNALGIINADGTGLRYLTATHDGTQFYAPSFSPDGSTILLGLFRQDCDRDIALLKPGTKTWRYRWERADSTKGFSDSTCFACDAEVKILLGTSHDERDPQFLPDGKGIVYSSDQNGVFNVYTMDLASGRAKRVTDVCGGAFCPTAAPDGDIWYSGYRAGDFSIYRLRDSQAVEELTPVAESRNYLAQAPRFALSKNFSVQPFQTKRLLNAVVPPLRSVPPSSGAGSA
jgi:Tol biopolymer transport system component